MTASRSITWSAKLLAACFFLFLTSHLITKIFDPDTWLHLHMGRFILQNRFIPSVNTFSFTQPDHPWMPHEWLSQVILYLFYSVFGATGLVVLRACVFLGVFVLLFRLVHKPGFELLNFAGMTLTVRAIRGRFVDRPEMFSALFLVSYFYILERWRQKGSPRQWIWLIPVIQALWVNMHGYFLFGPAFLVIFWFGEFGLPEGAFWGSRDSRRMLGVTITSFAACLLNPHLLRGITQLLEVAIGIGSPGIGEWLPPYSSLAAFWQESWSAPYKWLICVPALLWIFNRRGSKDSHWLLWGAFLLSYLQSMRNILFFSLVTGPVVLLNLRRVWENSRVKLPGSGSAWSRMSKLKQLLELGFAAFMVGSAYDVASGNYFARRSLVVEWGIGVSHLYQPVQACDFIETMGIEGPSFNNYDTGNYLMWRFPDRKVFVDGRSLEAYSRDFLSYSFRLAGGRIPVSELAGRYPVRSFVIDHQPENTIPLIQALHRDPKWTLAYVDHASVIFVPASRWKGAPTIRTPERDSMNLANKWERVWKHTHLSFILAQLGWRESAIEECRAALSLAPDFAPARERLNALNAETSRGRKTRV